MLLWPWVAWQPGALMVIVRARSDNYCNTGRRFVSAVHTVDMVDSLDVEMGSMPYSPPLPWPLALAMPAVAAAPPYQLYAVPALAPH